MKRDGLRALGVALAGIAALLRGGVSAAEAVRAGADRVPALGLAADRIASGHDPAAALAEALPGFAAALKTSDASLPDRLVRLSATCVRRYGLARRLRAVSVYPFVMAIGLLVIAAGVYLGDLWGRENLYVEIGTMMPPAVGPITLGAVAIVVFALGVFGFVRRTPPIWLRVLPGQRVYGLSAAADFLAFYAVHRDPTLGDLDAAAAAKALGAESAEAGLVARGAGFVVPMLYLAEASDAPGRALHDAVTRLDAAAARAARHLAASTATVLLVAIALGVVALGFSALYQPVFQLAQ